MPPSPMSSSPVELVNSAVIPNPRRWDEVGWLNVHARTEHIRVLTSVFANDILNVCVSLSVFMSACVAHYANPRMYNVRVHVCGLGSMLRAAAAALVA